MLFIRAITRLVSFAIVLGAPLHQVALADITLSGTTSCPIYSTFGLGEPVKLTFAASGLAPGARAGLLLTTKDEHDTVVEQRTVDIQADSSGKWTGDVDAPHQALGFYRVFASIGGATLPAQFTRPAGFLTYAIVPPPSSRKDYGQAETLFGMQGSFGPKSVHALPYLGARWVLAGYPWQWRERSHAGEFHDQDPANDNDVVSSELGPKSAAGTSWNTYRLYCVNGVPDWAGKPETRNGGSPNAELTAEGEKAYRSYCTEVAKNVVRLHSDEPRHYYQPLWEPVTPWGYKGTDAGLVRISKIAYEAIRAVDPKAVVAGPCGSSMDFAQIQWNERLLRAGIAPVVDAISIHPYVTHPCETHGYIENLRAFKAMTRRATGRDLAILGTEQGMSTNEDTNQELAQAEGLIRQNIITLGEGFKCNFAFYFSDYHMGREKGYGMYYNLDPKKNWSSDLVSPKPIAPAYAAMTLLLEGHHSNGPIEQLGGTSLGYVFQRDKDVIAALWDYGKMPHEVFLPVGVSRVQVYDWMGREHDIASDNGEVAISLGPEPVYVRGLSPNLYGTSGERRLAMVSGRYEALPGETVVVAAQVRRDGGAPKSNDRINVDATGLRAGTPGTPGGRDGSFRVPVAIPNDAAPGAYPVNLSLLRDGRVTGVAGAVIDVKPLVAAANIEEAFSDGQPSIAMTLTSNSSRAETVSVDIKVKEAPAFSVEKSIVLQARSQSELTIECAQLHPNPAQRYHVLVTTAVQEGSSSTQSAGLDFLTAPHFSAPPKIDGALSEWGDVPPVNLAGRENIVRSPGYYTGDLAAAIRYAWDESALYFACEVATSTHLQPYHDDLIWKGDCIQLAFNLAPEMLGTGTGNMAADLGSMPYTEMTFALTSDGPQCVRSVTFDPAKLPTGIVNPDDLKLAIAPQPGKIVYEAAIPWKTLGRATAPPAGATIAAAAAINKIYTADQADPTALGLFDGIASGKDPARFGTVLLRK